MDTTTITAVAAATGSLLGAAASIGTTWITQRTQTARTRIESRIRDRELLYGEFISEASRLTVEALTHSLEQPETMVKLYGIVGRIRLVAADHVLAVAEASVRQIINLYAQPNMTVEEIRLAFERDQLDPIKNFSVACRKELLELASDG